MNELEIIPNDIEVIPAGTARARWAHFDASTGLFVVGMNNGVEYKIAPSMNPGLKEMTADEIKRFEIVKDGTTIRWADHDLEIKLPRYLLIGLDNEFAVYGGKSFLAEMREAIERNPVIDHEDPKPHGDDAPRGKRRKDRHAS